MPAPPDRTDLALIEAIRADDAQAFDLLYHRYVKQLLLFTSHKLRAAETAEELVNDAFMTIWEKRHTLQIRSNVAAYLFTIMKNLVLQHLRRQQNQQAFLEEIAATEIPDGARADDGLYYEELSRSLAVIIDNLPDRCREIFLMSREDQKTTQEIADELQLSDQTVKNQLTKALNVLRYKLREITYFLFNLIPLIIGVLFL